MVKASSESSRAHWDRVHGSTAPDRLSWYQRDPGISLALIRAAAPDPGTRILDVGGGTSLLIDRLLEAGYRDVGLLDISGVAIDAARRRLGADAAKVAWFDADVLSFRSPHLWDVWHDRAVFHFLTDPSGRGLYRESLLRSLAPGGQAILATFGPTGPEMCSGLPAVRYSGESLGAELGPSFTLVESVPERHITPAGRAQDFLYFRFARSDSNPDEGS